MAYHVYSVGYAKDDEFEADAWAFKAQVKTGRTRKEALALTTRLLQRETAKGRSRELPKSESLLNVLIGEVESHYKSHPPTAERLRRLEAIDFK